MVESANCRIKQWRSLSNVMPNSQVPTLVTMSESYVLIKPPLLQNNEGDDIIAKRMIGSSILPNMLKRKVETNGWDTRVKS